MLSIYISLYLCYLQEEHDDEYEAEGEAADEFDSDFNDDVFLCVACIFSTYSSSYCSNSNFSKIYFFCLLFENRSLSLMQ